MSFQSRPAFPALLRFPWICALRDGQSGAVIGVFPHLCTYALSHFLSRKMQTINEQTGHGQAIYEAPHPAAKTLGIFGICILSETAACAPRLISPPPLEENKMNHVQLPRTERKSGNWAVGGVINIYLQAAGKMGAILCGFAGVLIEASE